MPAGIAAKGFQSACSAPLETRRSLIGTKRDRVFERFLFADNPAVSTSA